MEVRKRRNVHARGSGDAGSRGRANSGGRSTASSVDRKCTVFIVFVLGSLSLATVTLSLYPQHVPACVHNFVDKGMSAVGLTKATSEFAVILDAGSTGSRLLAFTFHRGLFDHALRLDDELWLEVKPGLSSYAERPAEAALSIEGLLAKAKERIPQSHWASTPVSLKATAGLRLLPKDQSEAILREVETTLRKSGFQPAPTLIEIMNPMEEGLFAWFTVNFLLSELSVPQQSHATLDLGGGSTQIVFVPSAKVEGLEKREHFTHEVSISGSSLNVYSHSYLGLGLMSAREAIFQADNPEGSTTLSSPCVKSDKPLQWQFKGKTYSIAAKNASPTNCLETVRKIIKRENVHVPKELASRKIAAFSYFYDRAVENGIMPKAFEGSAKVAAFKSAAEKACNSVDSEFNCVDLSFMYALFSDGYGLPDDKTISLFKKIDGHETSWALGVAFSLLEASSH